MTDDGPIHFRGAAEVLLWLCSTINAMIHTVKPTVCNRNLQFLLRCQVWQVPPDVLNVSVPALFCSRSSGCRSCSCLEMSLGLPGLFLLSACVFLILLNLLRRSV